MRIIKIALLAMLFAYSAIAKSSLRTNVLSGLTRPESESVKATVLASHRILGH